MMRRYLPCFLIFLFLLPADGASDGVCAQIAKKVLPVKITYEIYSGRNSPYFEVSKPEEIEEICRRLANLTRASEPKPPAEWAGSYMFEMISGSGTVKQLITVSKTNIQIQQKGTDAFLEDSKSLHRYLDELRAKHGLVGK